VNFTSKLKWFFVGFLVACITLFTALVAWGHEGHLSVLKDQTNVSLVQCPQLSGYVVQSNEYGCYLIYKQITFSHMAIHYRPLDLDEVGGCTCPTTIEGE
jgi:hypothetical protein